MQDLDSKSEHAEVAYGGKHHSFKKKGSKHKKLQSTGNDVFKGVAFCVGRKGPELYTKTVERMGLMYPIQEWFWCKEMSDAGETGESRSAWNRQETPHEKHAW